MPPTTTLVVNPVAGGGRAARAGAMLAARLRSAGLTVETVVTEQAGHGVCLARAALLAGSSTIVAVGGDGTAREVLTGFFEDGRLLRPAARLGIAPAGTGNDLARLLGPATRATAILLPDVPPVHVDVLRVRYTGSDGAPREHYGLLHGAVGVIAEAEGITVAPLLRRLAGGAVYQAMAVLAALRHRPHAVRYWLDQEPVVGEQVSGILVANCAWMGGGMPIAPEARIDDGVLDVIVARAVPRHELLRLLALINRGAHLTHPALRHARARRLRVEGGARLPLAIDGDLIGYGPVEFDLLPGVLPLVMAPTAPA